MLACGFRRYEALLSLAREMRPEWKDKKPAPDVFTVSKALGSQAPTMKVEIREMTEAQARAENVAENTARADLKSADCAFAVKQMRALGGSEASIAAAINKSQTYVSKLERLMTGLPLDVTVDWRKSPLPLSVDQMHDIAAIEGDETKKREAYEAATKAKTPGAGKDKTKAKAKVKERLTGQASAFGDKLGRLVRADLLGDMTEADSGRIAVHQDCQSHSRHSLGRLRKSRTRATWRRQWRKHVRSAQKADNMKPGAPAPKGKGDTANVVPIKGKGKGPKPAAN